MVAAMLLARRAAAARVSIGRGDRRNAGPKQRTMAATTPKDRYTDRPSSISNARKKETAKSTCALGERAAANATRTRTHPCRRKPLPQPHPARSVSY